MTDNRYAWYVVLLLAVVNVFNYMDRMALSVLMPQVKAELALSDAQLGLLVGFAFFFFYAVCGIPIARLADRGVRRDIVAISLGVWSVMTAISGAAQNFWHLFLARIGVGAGEAGGLAPAQSMICDYVPLERRPTAFAVHSFGLYAGMMAGMALAGWLGDRIGWRWTFVALGMPGIALALVVRLTLREPRRGALDAGYVEGSGSFRQVVRAVWTCRTYRLIMYSLVANGFAIYGLTQWWPSFYARLHGMAMGTIGVHLGIAFGVGMGAGVLTGGLIGRITAERDIRMPLWIGAAAIMGSAPAAIAALLVASAHASMALAGLTLFLLSIPSGPMIAAFYSVTPAPMRATGGAISIFFSSVLGFGLGPLLVGVLSDLLASSMGTESLRYALLAPILALPFGAILLHAAAQAMPADLRANAPQPKDSPIGRTA